jgi:hypothetical protein
LCVFALAAAPLAGTSVEDILTMIDEVVDFRKWGASMRQLLQNDPETEVLTRDEIKSRQPRYPVLANNE